MLEHCFYRKKTKTNPVHIRLHKRFADLVGWPTVLHGEDARIPEQVDRTTAGKKSTTGIENVPKVSFSRSNERLIEQLFEGLGGNHFTFLPGSSTRTMPNSTELEKSFSFWQKLCHPHQVAIVAGANVKWKSLLFIRTLNLHSRMLKVIPTPTCSVQIHIEWFLFLGQGELL